MLVRKVVVQNVRSFLERQEFLLDGQISIVIGPNGRGKTNLLDAVVTILRRYLLTTMHPAHTPTAEQQDRFEFRPQRIEIELEATERDIENMQAMQDGADDLVKRAGNRHINLTIQNAKKWNLTGIKTGDRFPYVGLVDLILVLCKPGHPWPHIKLCARNIEAGDMIRG